MKWFLFLFFLFDFLSSWITYLPMVTILNYQEKNDYPLTSNRKCTYPLAKSGLAHSTNYGMNLLSQENAE